MLDMRTYVRDESRIGNARFRRALKTGNMAIIRSAAGELPHVDLGDALAVCVVIHNGAFENITDEPAALETLQRLCSRWASDSPGVHGPRNPVERLDSYLRATVA
jgi:hypothetical protein